MTVHRAKGLEFPLVCVGRPGQDRPRGRRRAARDRRRPVRHAAGLDLAASRSTAPRWPGSRRSRRPTTRRRSGGSSTSRPPAPRSTWCSAAPPTWRSCKEPADLTEPMRWIWRAAGPAPRRDGERGRGGRRVRRPRGAGGVPGAAPGRRGRAAARGRPPPGAARARAARPRGAGRARAGGGPGARRRGRSAGSATPGLAAYRRCGYRFYLDRALRLPPPDDGPARARPRRRRRGRAAGRPARLGRSTSCSRSSTSTRPRRPPRERVGRG